MTPALNHTIVHSSDARASAAWLAEVLGLPAPTTFGHFQVVELANGVSLDFADAPEPIVRQHYAFLVTEDEWDEIFARLAELGVPHYADPAGRREGEINRNDGGRGCYFAGPDGHWYEIITRPYGSG